MSHPNAATLACTVCGEAGHKASRCKSLGLPPPGFHTGGNGGGGHSHDDEDEKAAASIRTARLSGDGSYEPCGTYWSCETCGPCDDVLPLVHTLVVNQCDSQLIARFQ